MYKLGKAPKVSESISLVPGGRCHPFLSWCHCNELSGEEAQVFIDENPSNLPVGICKNQMAQSAHKEQEMMMHM